MTVHYTPAKDEASHIRYHKLNAYIITHYYMLKSIY